MFLPGFLIPVAVYGDAMQIGTQPPGARKPARDSTPYRMARQARFRPVWRRAAYPGVAGTLTNRNVPVPIRTYYVNMHILLIEDDRDAAAYLIRGLCESGHQVDHAANGEDGLHMGLTAQYDVLVVDRMLPGRDGLSVISMLRAGGDRTPAQLARAFHVTRGAMTNTLGRLEWAGYVHVRPDWDDARRKLVTISPAGRAARDAAIAAITPRPRPTTGKARSAAAAPTSAPTKNPAKKSTPEFLSPIASLSFRWAGYIPVHLVQRV